MSLIRRQTGFTLVELVTCIIILGIVAVVAGPKLLDNNTLAARTYSNEVAAAVREAQAVAIATGCEVAITLNATNYIAQQRSNAATCNSSGSWSLPVLRADGTTLTGTAPGTVRLSSGTRIVFAATGRPLTPPPTVTIDTYQLQVQAYSGLVTLQ